MLIGDVELHAYNRQHDNILLLQHGMVDEEDTSVNDDVVGFVPAKQRSMSADREIA